MQRLRKQLRWFDRRYPDLPVWVWAPLFALAVANWLTGLPVSYAIDETGGYYVASAGPVEAVRRAAAHTGQSLLFQFVASFFLWPLDSPYREAVSRIPSLLSLAGATWMIYRAGERWSGRGAGVVAAVLFASIPGVAAIGIQMRQYGLLWLLASAYLWFFWSWCTEGRRGDFWWSRLALGLCVSAHFLAGLLLAVDFVLVIWRRRLSLVYVAATAAAVLVPIVPIALALPEKLTEAGTWRYGRLFPFTVWDLGGYLPLRLTLGLALAGLAARWLWPRVWRKAIATRDWKLFLWAWLLLIPAALWLLNEWSETWQVRYLLLASPAAVLLAGTAFARLAPSARAAALALPLLAVLPLRLLLPAGAENFRLASEVVADLNLYEVSPLLAPSWFVEAHVDDAAAFHRRYPSVWGHLIAYPVPNPVYPLPVWYSERHVEPALTRLLAGPLQGQKRLLVAATAWTRAFQRPLEASGFRIRLNPVGRGIVVAECVR
jgi:hypothetical protein